MKSFYIFIFHFYLFFFILVFVACSPGLESAEKGEPPQAAKQDSLTIAKDTRVNQWDMTLAEAKKEGKVIIMSSLGSELRTALSQGFKDKYGLTVEWVIGRPAELVQKLSVERRSGIYLADVFATGSTIQLQVKTLGFQDPLSSALIIPEVTDSSLWYGGKLNFVDKERKYVFPFLLYPSVSMFVNSDFIKAEDLKSYRDLLSPNLKGKIIMGDPTTPGSALRWFRVIGEKIMGLDYLRELVRNEISIQRDDRLVVDWVAKAKHSVGIGAQPDLVTEYRNAGAPVRLFMPAEGTWLTSGTGAISAINSPAHPAARNVFINWLLSREGQTIYSRATKLQSARVDVSADFLEPLAVRKQGMTYFISEDEEFFQKNDEAVELARQMFGALIQR